MRTYLDTLDLVIPLSQGFPNEIKVIATAASVDVSSLTIVVYRNNLDAILRAQQSDSVDLVVVTGINIGDEITIIPAGALCKVILVRVELGLNNNFETTGSGSRVHCILGNEPDISFMSHGSGTLWKCRNWDTYFPPKPALISSLRPINSLTRPLGASDKLSP